MQVDQKNIAQEEKREAAISSYPTVSWKRKDKTARWVIWIFSAVIFLTIAALGKLKVNVNLGFEPHIFARVNAYINGTVSILLVGGLIAVKTPNYNLHKRFMFVALILSILFLVSYVCHHLFTGDTKFGGEGAIRYVYFFILITHICLAAVILPFILFTTYRSLTGQWILHRKLARITWPIWLYVSVTGVAVYMMISPYYH
jgi:putative membrane protein